MVWTLLLSSAFIILVQNHRDWDTHMEQKRGLDLWKILYFYYVVCKTISFSIKLKFKRYKSYILRTMNDFALYIMCTSIIQQEPYILLDTD